MIGKNTNPSINGSLVLVVAAALGATCRGYDVDPPERSNSGGANLGGSSSGDSGDSGASGSDDGASGSGGGGDSGSATGGARTGGSSGSAGTNAGGTGGDDTNGGAAGAGAGGAPEPGILGAVRVLIDGEPKCGGSLLTNDWVLTADQCVSDLVETTSLEVGFGMDSEHFEQTRTVLDVQPFPGSVGSGRDLLLLGLEAPFEIDGRTSGYHRPLWAVTPELALEPHRCVGWDLDVSEQSPTSKLHEETLVPQAFELEATTNFRLSGSRVWWLNGNKGQVQGVLPMPADVGSACFHTVSGTIFQDTVHSGNPEERRDGGANIGREAYSVALGEHEVRRWLDTELFDYVVEDIQLVGDPGVCASRPDRIELFGLISSGIGWFTWEAARGREGIWTARFGLGGQDGVTFGAQAPGAYCASDGNIAVFVPTIDGTIWWRRREPGGNWAGPWEHVSVARTPVSTGLSVVGLLPDHFFVFGGAASGELRYAEYDASKGGWIDEWFDLGGSITGTPSAVMTQEGRIDVYALGTDNRVHGRSMQNGAWSPDWFDKALTSDPTVVSWNNLHFDVIARSPAETYAHDLYHAHAADLIVTNILMPSGTPSAVARQPGTMDIFVTIPDVGVWHGFWPRKPKPNDPE